jgi:hypothetical protein
MEANMDFGAPQAVGKSGSSTGMRRTAFVLIPLLLLLYVLQCTWFIRTQSFTDDEPEHLVGGIEAVHFGEFQRWPGHPPLGRMLFALPLVHTDWRYHIENDQVRLDSPGPEVWLYRSRSVVVTFGVLLLLLLWATARDLFSETTAYFVLALAVLSPELIADFSLADTDGIGCLLLFACVIQWLRYWRDPSLMQATLLAVFSGLALLAKYNAPPLLAILFLMVLGLAPGAVKLNPAGLQWKRTLGIALVACMVAWAGFFFHVSKVTFADQMVTLHFSGYTKILQYEMPTLKTPISIFIPACEWLTGFGWQVAEDMVGHRSFLLGHYSSTSFKLYYPTAILLKWPLLVLLLGAAGAWVVLRHKVPGSRDLLLLSIFPTVYFLIALSVGVDLGVRHVLPLYPFLLLYAGAFVEWAGGWHWNVRRTKFLLCVLLVAQAFDIARYAPDYLSYFTIFVKPANTWQLLSDSNTDWGQGLVALRRFQDRHPNEPLHLAYFGEVDPAFYGIRYIKLQEQDRPSGLVVVSATHLSGQLLHDHYAYRWLLRYPAIAILNHTLYVFDVPNGAAQPGVEMQPTAPNSQYPGPFCTAMGPACQTSSTTTNQSLP